MAVVQSVNIGAPRPIIPNSAMSGIDKMPTRKPIAVSAPAPDRPGESGLLGDTIGDTKHHGGADQAVYAYAREDLDWWQAELGEPIRPGMFGENLTTDGLDVTGARIGEKWRIGEEVVLQVTAPRIPCATFAVWMNQKGWIETFTRRAHPGAYLRVLMPGAIRADDPVVVEFQPEHDVTVGMTFRALTLEPALLPRLRAATEYLTENIAQRVTGVAAS